jgi:hypothetical protein
MNEPIFQIIKPGLHIKIYSNGVVEGIEEPYTISNCIPFAITAEARERFRFKNQNLPYTKSNESSSASVGASHSSPRQE